MRGRPAARPARAPTPLDAWWPPPPGLGIALGLWLIVLVVWGTTGGHRFGSLAFFVVAAACASYVATVARVLADGRPALVATRRGLLLVVLVLVPVVFDMRPLQGFDAPKVAVTAVGAVLVAGLWAIDVAGGGAAPRWRNGLHWPVLAFVAWTLVATVFSSSPLVSFWGHYGFWNGSALVVCAAVLFFAVAADFTAPDVKAVLSALYLGAGGLVAFYGLLQLHDRFTTVGGRWDWALSATGASGSFDTTRQIWSTLGNPNFLSGFLVVLLPVGLVLAVLSPSRRTRLAIGVVGAAMMVEVLQATTRGALIAVVVSLGLLAVLSARDLRALKFQTRRLLAIGLVGVVGVVAVGVLLNASGKTRYSVSAVANGSGTAGNTASERIELWRASVRIAGDHLLLGTGPDTYGDYLAHYQSAKLVRLAGPEFAVDGPHNIVLEYAATLGIIGVLLFLGILVMAGLRAWRARAALDDLNAAQRLLIAGVGAAVAAFFVQAFFNVNTIALTVLFWMLLGLLAVLTNGSPGAEPVTPAGAGAARRGTRNRRSAAARRDARITQSAVGVVVALAVVAVAVVSVRPDLAGRSYYRAVALKNGVRQAAAAKDANTALATYQAADQSFRRASQLSFGDPIMLEARADFLATFLQSLTNPSLTAITDALHTSERLMGDVIAADPQNARARDFLARVIKSEASVTKGTEPLGRESVLLRRAVALNPYVSTYAIDLSVVQIASGTRDQALATIKRARTYSPSDKALTDAQSRIEAGNTPATPPTDVVGSAG